MAVLGSIHVLWWHGWVGVDLEPFVFFWRRVELSDALIDQILMLD